jgi:DNA adenine methylase
LPAQLRLVRYIGGKQALVQRLLPLIPEHFAYVEVFGGGGALLLNKPHSQLEVYNDLDGELVNLFEVVRDDPDAFLKRARFLLYSRELYQKWQKDLKRNAIPSDPVERAVRFWYLLRCSFGAHPHKGWGFTRSTRSLSRSFQNSLANILAVHERLKTVQIDHLDFRRCIDHYDAPNTFIFLDPPYLDTTSYNVGKFTLEDHEDLARMLRGCKSRWLLTIGDCQAVRRLYTGFHQENMVIPLSVEKAVGSSRHTLRNLIIRNYRTPKVPQYVSTAADMPLLDLFSFTS